MLNNNEIVINPTPADKLNKQTAVPDAEISIATHTELIMFPQ